MRQATAPLVTISALTKSFGSKPLFESISLVLARGERTALIGPNGSGKSTLFKILAGLEDADSGEVVVQKGSRLSYVPQEESFADGLTVDEALKQSLDDHQPNAEALLSIYSGKAGFHDRTQLVSNLSGGWKKRLAIVCGLIREPDLLLLDEPTNHLDIESILWLEDLLLETSAAVLFISHDRYFLEHIAERVIELDRRYVKGHLSNQGTYSTFLETREAFFEQMESYKDSLQNKVRREVEWLRRGAKARTTKARGRIKQANELINELQSLRIESNTANLTFLDNERQTRELIKVVKIERALGGKSLFSDLSMILSPGSRVGISGANGTGKTTLVKTLIGTEPPDKGTVKLAHRLRVAYFDQRRAALDPDMLLKKALCDEGDTVVFGGKELHVASWAKRFLFRTEQLMQPLRSLSGGERARVLLAQLMVQPADVLVLDEPTNDLDISTLEVLEESLCEFAGAVVLVTHDRHFLDRVCTSVVGLDGNGNATIYGSYMQWELARDEQRALEEEEARKEKAKKSGNREEKKKDSPSQTLTYAERKELDSLERKIETSEKKLLLLQGALGEVQTSGDSGKIRAHCEELAKVQKNIDELYSRWQELEGKRAG